MDLHDPKHEPTSAEKEAAAWFARWLSRPFSDKEQREFDAWHAKSPENANAYSDVLNFWNRAEALAGSVSPMDWSSQIYAQRNTLKWGLLAATLCFVALVPLTLGWFIYTESGNSSIQHESGRSIERTLVKTQAANLGTFRSIAARNTSDEFATDGKHRSSIFLSDGSVVTLNPNTKISVQYSSLARVIFLLQGRARFKVAKHQKIPFYVYARDKRIIATGTAFDVALDDRMESVEVALMEGSVTVDRPDTKNSGEEIVANLNPGTRLIVKDGVPPLVTSLRDYDSSDTHSDSLVFLDTPLEALVGELNRYGHRQIHLEDRKLGTLRIDGRLRTDDPVAVARGIAQIYSLNVSEVSKTTIELRWR